MLDEKKSQAVELADDDLDQAAGGRGAGCGPRRRSVDDEECTTVQSETQSKNQTKASFPICHK
jgi:hypothetical protein